MIAKLEELDAYIELCLLTQNQQGVLTQENLDSISKELTQNAIDSSNFQTNKDQGEKLLESLSPATQDPLYYKTFKLTLQNDPDNTLMLARRRVIATSAESNITLRGDFSYSSSTEILVKEMQFRIDQFLSPPPEYLAPEDIPVIPDIIEIPEEEEIQLPEEPYTEYKKGEYWKYSNHPSVFYTGPNNETIEFADAMEFKIHRSARGFPMDFSQIEPRGDKPGYTPSTTTTSTTSSSNVKKYYSSRQSQDLSDIALATNVTVSTLESLNPTGLNPNKNQKDGNKDSFYKNPRKANKRKPDKGSQIRYE